MTELDATGMAASALSPPEQATVLGVVLPCAAVAMLGAIGLSWYLMGPYKDRRVAASLRDRQQIMRSLAHAYGWSWQGSTTTLNNRWVNAAFAARGGEATNLVSGSLRGYPVLAFDYKYVSSTMDPETHRLSTITYDWSVCVLRLPSQLPVLLATRRGWLGRMVAIVLPTGLRVPGGAFRRRFKIWSSDRNFARDVLHARTRELMIAGDVSYLIEDADLLCWASAGQSAEQLLARLGLLADIADVIYARR
ncbi:MAG TPA: hypothetical protein VFR67_06970 [Pilimelia sp.]|nr:hypothetical protein [Pilimelia sp.]